MNFTTLTVTQISSYIKSSLENDSKLKNVMLVGEISNFTNHYKTGHFYFTLKDDKTTIKAVMFKSYATLVNFVPFDGMKVVVKGNINVYMPNGTYQINCTQMLPKGEGSYNIAFNQLKDKLELKGYFDVANKKEIQKNPKVIGLISAIGSAALKDVISVVERRNPFCKILVYGSIMQGEHSANSVIASIKKAINNTEVEVIIIARGGGSTEDLWSFNNEKLVETVFFSQKPIISAIAQEVDSTI